MRSVAWINLFGRIPSQQQDDLVLTTSTGIEIAIQTILRLDEDFMVVRGRLAGSMDSGRVFFVPYNQLSHLSFLRPKSEAEVKALFDERASSANAVPLSADSAATSPSAELAAPSTTSDAPVAPLSPNESRGDLSTLQKQSSRDELLQRMRQRASDRSANNPSEQQ